jgi:glycosyltransferase involved in cell wall biosynthesis
MRIAYVAPYQGTELVKRRPTLLNFSLAARVKIGLIAQLLRREGHDVDVLSQGEIIETRFKFYRGFSEPDRFHEAIPIHYASALPIRRLNGLWSGASTRRLLRKGHRLAAYDLVIIYNLKLPQVMCGIDAIERMGAPLVLQYEDDAFADVWGNTSKSFRLGWQRSAVERLFKSISACMAVSPYLLSQVPPSVSKLLLRGVVSDALLDASREAGPRRNRVVFSGTHENTQGLEQLLQAWKLLRLKGWELHMAGYGPITPLLQSLAADDPSIIFHGLLNVEENARLLCTAKIGMNPQDLTRIPGNVFAFKIVEYLAAGLHVITTPRGAVEPELEAGISYIADPKPETIAAHLSAVVSERRYEKTAQNATVQRYGPAAVSRSLDSLLKQAVAPRRSPLPDGQARIAASAD